MFFYYTYKNNKKILKNFFIDIKLKNNIHFRDATIDDIEYIKNNYVHWMEKGHYKHQNKTSINNIVNAFLTVFLLIPNIKAIVLVPILGFLFFRF